MSTEPFRVPIPVNLGPNLGTSVLQNRPPKSMDVGEDRLAQITQRLFQVATEVSSKGPPQLRKKSKKEVQDEKRLTSALLPTVDSKGKTFWNLFKVSLGPQFSETYVTSGVGGSSQMILDNSVSEQDQPISSFVQKTKKLLLNEEVIKEIEKSAPGDQIQPIVPKLGKTKLKKLKKVEREKTKGERWFNMAAPEMTPELQNELDILKMRSAIDQTRFYKKADSSAPPKYFQIGHVIDSAVDFYSDRITKKDRKKTLVDELMADAEFKKFSKRKYVEIIAEKNKTQRKRFKHSDKSKNKSKKAKAK